MSRSSLKEFVKNSGVNIIRSDSQPLRPVSRSSTISFNNLARVTPARVTPVSSRGSFGNLNQVVAGTPSISPVNNNTPVKVGKLRVGMYNVLVNSNYDDSVKVDLLTLVSKKPLKPTMIENGLIVDVKEINGLYGRFQTGIKVTRNKGFQGEFTDKYFTVQFKITVSKNGVSKDVSFNVYKNGKIRFSGGVVDENNFSTEPESIRRHIIDNYTLGQRFLYNPLEFNNLSATIKTSAVFDLAKVARMMNASYEPELIDLLYYQNNGIKYVFSRTGVVQIQGVTGIPKIFEGYEKLKQMIAKIYRLGGVRNIISNFRDVVDVKKIKKVKTTCPKPRIPVNGKCPTEFPVIRKNPQGYDCCYKKGKAKSKTPPKSKTPSPQNVRLVLDPNGGLKIGSRQCMRYSREALANIARNQGIINIKKGDRKEDICAKLVNKLGIVQYAPFTHNGKEYIFTGNGDKFKIGRRVCKTYDIATLRMFLKKMNIPFTSSEKRPALCKKIEAARVKLPSPNKTPSPKPKKRGRPPKKNKTPTNKSSKGKSPVSSNSNNNNNLIKNIEKMLQNRNLKNNKNKSKSKNKNVVQPTIFGARARVEQL
jgi:hypothetical protein